VCRERAVGGKYFGRTVARRGLREGRQAVMMLTFVSTAERVAAGGLSAVGSVEFDIDRRDWRRTTDTMHTLGEVSESLS
jgi:hypothetical protein